MNTPRRFAAETTVSVEKSKAELSTLLGRHGASQTGFFDDREAGRAVVIFKMAGRQVKLSVKLPDPQDKKFLRDKRGARFNVEQARARWEQECRSSWRRVLLVTKAKLEIVADGESTLEREFLADLLLVDGQTVHEVLKDRIAEMYETGRMPPLLPGKSADAT